LPLRDEFNLAAAFVVSFKFVDVHADNWLDGYRDAQLRI
jgi:hypothetical protein